MTALSRDEFTKTTRDTIARRSGYRCAFPNCRKLTIRPDPSNPSSSVNEGIAAHICAASPEGPRYDPAMTREQRTSAENGIWLCGTCSQIVDKLPNTYSSDTLRYWKQSAERATARDAQTTAYDIDDLIAEVSELYDAMISFVQKWNHTNYQVDRTQTWEEMTNKMILHSNQRRHDYLIEIQPQLLAILEHISAALGRPSLMEELRSSIIGAQTNNLGVEFMAEELQKLRSQLLYR